MIRNFFSKITVTLILLLVLFSLNIMLSKLNPDKFFPIIFVLIGCSDIFIGISSLNAKKKLLSIFNFSLGAFFIILVASKIFILS